MSVSYPATLESIKIILVDIAFFPDVMLVYFSDGDGLFLLLQPLQELAPALVPLHSGHALAQAGLVCTEKVCFEGELRQQRVPAQQGFDLTLFV